LCILASRLSCSRLREVVNENYPEVRGLASEKKIFWASGINTGRTGADCPDSANAKANCTINESTHIGKFLIIANQGCILIVNPSASPVVLYADVNAVFRGFSPAKGLVMGSHSILTGRNDEGGVRHISRFCRNDDSDIPEVRQKVRCQIIKL
jgi:hypothetical protein